MAEGCAKKRQIRHHFHLAHYLDAGTLAQCWLPFIGEGAVFVPAHPVRACLTPEAATAQILMLQLPGGKQYCLEARIVMIMPAGTGPLSRGGYLMLLLKPPSTFLDAVERCIKTDKISQRPLVKSIPQWLLSFADSKSDNTIQ